MLDRRDDRRFGDRPDDVGAGIAPGDGAEQIDAIGLSSYVDHRRTDEQKRDQSLHIRSIGACGLPTIAVIWHDMTDFCIHIGLYRRLIEAAAASPDAEICGLLFGGDGRIDAIRPTANVAADPASGFEVDPVALIAAHRAARRGGPRPIGHFHSHPRGPASPSPRDLAAAENGSLWLIIGHGNAGHEARLWRATAGNFLEVNLIFARLAPK